MIDSGLLLLHNLILVGDLKFTLGANEIWGTKAHLNPLMPLFSQLIADHNLVDLAPPYAGPTWRNGRSGVDGISKRLDKFLLSAFVVPSMHRHRVWSTPSDISDHYPICMEWEVENATRCFPFKFNKAWLLEEDFFLFVKDCWGSWVMDPEVDEMKGLSLKLRFLKKKVKA